MEIAAFLEFLAVNFEVLAEWSGEICLEVELVVVGPEDSVVGVDVFGADFAASKDGAGPGVEEVVVGIGAEDGADLVWGVDENVVGTGEDSAAWYRL